MAQPRSAFGAFAPRGRRQRPGQAGSAAAAWVDMMHADGLPIGKLEI